MSARQVLLYIAAVVSPILMAPRMAEAQPIAQEQVRLTWIREGGAENCPPEEQVARDVTARLGRNPFSPKATRSIRGLVIRKDGHWSARIDERQGDTFLGSRVLPSEAPDCASLHGASVFVIALLIDPEAALGPPPAPRAAPVPPPPRAAPPALPSKPGAPPPPSSPSPLPVLWPKATFHVRSGVSALILPRATFGLALAAGVRGRVIEGSVGMRWLPEARTDDGAFAFGLTAAWLGACVHVLRFRRGSLATCGAVLGGAVHGVVVELSEYEPLKPGDRAWMALSLSPLLRVSLAGPLSAELGADLIVPVTRYKFTRDGATVFIQPPIGAFGFAGLGVSIP